MAIRKIQAGRITTVTTPNFIGEKGAIFYDETLADLRISDGHTPGGRLINIAGGLTDVLITDPQSGQTLQYNGTKWVNVNPGTIELSTATTTQLGGIKLGTGLQANGLGVVSVNTGSLGFTTYSLTTATAGTLGGVKIGSGLTASGDGTISATASALTTATASVLGGIKVGKDLSISNTGTLNLDLSAVTQNITPKVDAVYSLGTPSLKWKDIYVSTGSVYIGDLKLSSVNGALKVENIGNTGSDSSSVSIGTVRLSDYNSSLKISSPLTFPDGTTQTSAASSLEISEIDTANSLTNTVTNVTAIRFDKDTGFSVTDLGAGQVKVSLGSSFKTWKVAGQSDVVAVGEDTVEFKAGDGITLTTNPTAPDKSMTISGYMYWSSKNW